MIAKAKSISHTGAALTYAEEKLDAELIDRYNLFAQTPTEIENEFKICQNLNDRCERNSISFVLSPEPKSGQHLTTEDYKKVASDFLEKMNLKKNQSVVYMHKDKAHTHLHIFTNRIDFQGKAYKDHFISKKAQTQAQKMAQEMGLTTAKEIQLVNENNRKILSNSFEQAHETAIKGKIETFEDYQKAMKNQGYNIEKAMSKNTGKVSGLRVGKLGEKPLKISSVSRKIGTKLTKNFGAQMMNITPVGKVLSIAKKTKSVTRTISRGMGI